MRLYRVLPLFLLASSALAQQVTLRGKVEDVSGTSQFIVDCTDTELVSSAFNLNDFVGQQALIGGLRLPGGGPPVVDVTSISVIPETFEIPGNPEAGGTIRFGATYTPGSQVTFKAALGPGFLSVGQIGTYFLDTGTDVRIATRIVPPPGNIEIAIPLPDDPGLIGLDVYAQAVHFSGGQFVLSNPDCKTIE